MPRLPDADAAGARVAIRETRTETVDRSEEISAAANIDFARTTGAAVDQVITLDNQFRYAKAKSELLAADIAGRKALESDDDFESYETKYGDGMTKALESAGKNIRSPRDRERFELEARQDLLRGTETVRQFAQTRERDWGVASLNEALERNRRAALEAADEPTRAAFLRNSQELITGAKQRRYLSDTQAEELGRKYAESYAEGALVMQPPERRIDMLSKPDGTPAQMLAPDRRAVLLEAAKRESEEKEIRRQSQAYADSFAAAGLTDMGEKLERARRIKDPSVRAAVEQSIRTDHANQELIKRERSEQRFDGVMDAIEKGATRKDIAPEVWIELTPQQRTAVEQRLAAPGGTVKTDINTYYKLAGMATSDPQAFGELDLRQEAGKLSTEDFKTLTNLQLRIRSGDAKDPLAANFRNMNQTVDEYILKLYGDTTAKGEKQGKIIEFRARFDDRKREIEAQNKKKLSVPEARKILDEMTTEVSLGYFRSKRAFELKPGDIEDVPDAYVAPIIKALKRFNPDAEISDDAILDAYRKIQATKKKP